MLSSNLDRLYAAAFFMFGLVACAVFLPWNLPFLLDNQIYFFISERVASGEAPHLAHFDPKNALSMMATGAAMVLGRVVGLDDVVSARLLSVVVTAASTALVWFGARGVCGGRLGAHAAGAAFLSFSGFFMLGAMGARPKVFMTCALAASLVAVERRAWAAVGALGAAAFLCWQPALLALGGAVVAMVAAREERRSYLRLALGALGVVGVYELYFVWHGGLAEQLYQALVFPPSYAKPGMPVDVVLGQVFGWRGSVTPATVVMTGVGLVLLAAPLLAIAKRRELVRRARSSPEFIYVWVMGLATMGFLAVDFQGYPDRFFVAPFVSVIFGLLVARCVAAVVSVGSSVRSPVVEFILVGVVMLALAGSSRMGVGPGWLPYTLEDQRAGARVVAQDLERGRSVYAIGCPHLLALNRAGNWSRFGFFPWRIRQHFLELHAAGVRFSPAIDGKFPDVVLESRAEFQLNRLWLREHYNLANIDTLSSQRVRRWVRRDLGF